MQFDHANAAAETAARTTPLTLLASAGRATHSLVLRLTILSGWTWVAAGSLIGFEMLDIVFGAFILAPEFLPLVILALAGIWFFRERLKRLIASARDRIRARQACR